MTTVVFDIETVPDVELGRRALGLEGLDDSQVADAMFTLARQRSPTCRPARPWSRRIRG